jgi:tetratricopeptide (TPR) repeat protein
LPRGVLPIVGSDRLHYLQNTRQYEECFLIVNELARFVGGIVLGEAMDMELSVTATGDEVAMTKNELQSDVQRLISALEKTYATKPKQWYETVYDKVSFFTKYIGIPGLVLASLLPTYNVISSIIEYKNGQYLSEVYSSYTKTLLERNEIDRANAILSDLKTEAQKSVENRYLQAKVLARMALYQSRRQVEAEDRINLLLEIHRNRGVFFPSLGGEQEVFELEMSLVDIDVSLQRYDAAERRLQQLQSGPLGVARANIAAIQLRRGQISVLTFKIDAAERNLISALPVFQQLQDSLSLGEAWFQLAKARQFASKSDESLDAYNKAREVFQARDDKFNLLRVYNNIGMLHQAKLDYAKARYFYELEQKLARELGDDLGLARSLVNLSLIARNEGRLPDALILAQEAMEAFKKQGNKLGVASAYQNLSVTYQRQNDISAAIYNANQALLIFEDVGDLRGLASIVGLLGNIHQLANDLDEAGPYYLAWFALQRHLKATEQPDVARDLLVYKGSINSIRTSLGDEEFRKRFPTWLKKTEKLLIPNGVINPEALVSDLLGEG